MKLSQAAAVNLLNMAMRRLAPARRTAEQVGTEQSLSPEDQKLLSEVLQAREEWLSAHSYFNNATDPALVDHSILLLQAAERKYMFLLNEAKARGLAVDRF
ncbi:MAG: YaaL family protein [Limnochordia bacterium]|jgi:hypothetical protein